MKKVKVSLEEFEALNLYYKNFDNHEKWIYAKRFLVTPLDFLEERYNALKCMDKKRLVDSVYYGYELELTPHQKIKKIFDENMLYNKGADTSSVYSTGFLEGILSTLEALGEKVEGVNK